METMTRTDHGLHDNLVMLRKRVSALATQSEDELLLAEVVALLSGEKRPCVFTQEEMAAHLQEADEDYRAGRFVAQEDLRLRYGL